jgi:hypothetical protein
MTWATLVACRRPPEAVGTRRAFKTHISGWFGRVASGTLFVTDGFYDWKKLDAKGKLKPPVGGRVIALYRAIETNARTAANQEFRFIGKLVRLERGPLETTVRYSAFILKRA